MKIRILTHEFPPFRGGIGTYTAQLAIAAHRIGHEIVVSAPDFGYDLRRQDELEYPFVVERYRGGTYTVRQLPALLARTWRLGSRSPGDLLHAADPSYTMALAFVNRFKRVPFVATAFGTEILSLRISRQAAFLRTGDLFEKATIVFAISEFTQSLLHRHCPTVQADRIRVTPLGVDSYWFENPGGANSIREEFGIPADHSVILTVARLDERKGHATVLKGIAALDDAVKKRLTYVIVGKGSDKSYGRLLRELAGKCGVRVVFVEDATREVLRELYATADIFCMPGEAHTKKVEGFGLAYLEAAAQGVPSIGSHTGAVPEVVRHGDTGLLIEPGDARGLSDQITQLIVDPDRRRKMGEKARAWARNFTWQRCAELTYGAVGSPIAVLGRSSVER